jgi:hypothetical protein
VRSAQVGMSPRAARMADATRLPMHDRRAAGDGAPLAVDGVVVPRRGDAVLDVDGRRIACTHLDRVLWPATGFTKAALIAYYLAVAPVLLPQLRDRPLTVGRFPGGVDGRGFAQQEVPGRPDWVRAVPLPLVKGETKAFTLVDDARPLPPTP